MTRASFVPVKPWSNPLEAAGQPPVINAHAMRDRNIQVPNMHGFTHNVVTEVVRIAILPIPPRTPPPAIQIVNQRGG